MQCTDYKKIIVALLLMALTSQSMAVLVMPCQFQSQFQNQTQSPSDATAMAGMDHSMQMMNHSMPSNENKTPDCCKRMEDCLIGGCALIGMSNTVILSFMASSSAMEDSYTGMQVLSLVSSLYRPPIFR
jgi:hypothetical protein